MRASRLRSLVLVLASLTAAACAESTTPGHEDGGPIDAATSDADVSDGALPDAGQPDAYVPDASEPTCTGFTCGANSTCTLASDAPTCVCDAGFQDEDGNGSCSPDCTGVTCSDHGSCATSTGTALCACTDDHAGPDCADCVVGKQDRDEDGVCTPSCASTVCDAHEVCDDESGTALCACADGYVLSAGDTCEPTCAVTTCGDNATCDDTSGAAICSCAVGTTDEDGDGNCSAPCSVYGGTASAGPGVPGDDPALAFDGNVNTQFNAITSGVSNLTYDYGASSSPVVVSYTLYSYGYSASAVFGFHLLGSQDATSWTTLDTRSTTLPIGAGPRRFAFANTTGYRYYRLEFFDAAGGFVRVQEVQLNTCR